MIGRDEPLSGCRGPVIEVIVEVILYVIAGFLIWYGLHL